MTNRLITGFYDIKVRQLLDKRFWDLPVLEETADVHTVLNILGARNHVWVINNKQEKKLLGVITEHDVLSILAPKRFSPYVFGMPDIRSLQYGTAKTAGDIMTTKIITCTPDEKIIDVLQVMSKHRLRRLPVVEGNTLVGEVTLNQLIRKYYEATQFRPIVENEKRG